MLNVTVLLMQVCGEGQSGSSALHHSEQNEGQQSEAVYSA